MKDPFHLHKGEVTIWVVPAGSRIKESYEGDLLLTLCSGKELEAKSCCGLGPVLQNLSKKHKTPACAMPDLIDDAVKKGKVPSTEASRYAIDCARKSFPLTIS